MTITKHSAFQRRPVAERVYAPAHRNVRSSQERGLCTRLRIKAAEARKLVRAALADDLPIGDLGESHLRALRAGDREEWRRLLEASRAFWARVYEP